MKWNETSVYIWSAHIAMTTELDLQTELRHLPLDRRQQLVMLLDLNNSWKSLATVLVDPDEPLRLLIRYSDIEVLEEQLKRNNGSPSNCLFEYWSTYGRRRPTFKDAIKALEQCGLDRAAAVISSALSEKERNTLPTTISTPFEHKWTELPNYSLFDHVRPTAPTYESTLFSTTTSDNTQHFTDHVFTCKEIVRFTYKQLRLATDDFSSKSIAQGGTKLGEGSFGEVFRAEASVLALHGFQFTAVKRFKHLSGSNDGNDDGLEESKREEFISELNLLFQFRHPKLVKLLGYSIDGPQMCIVTEYLQNESLQCYLAFNRQPMLNFAKRLEIAIDVAEALVYLHTYYQTAGSTKEPMPVDKPFVHRDVKSANIFLDHNLCARLGDLGLVRQGSQSVNTTIVTKTVIGTSLYMAPEAFRGDVSIKMDTFSFGVVLIELLTGMQAYDSCREEPDIVNYFEDVLGEELESLGHGHTLDKNDRLFDFLRAWPLDTSKVTSFVDTRFESHHQPSLVLLTLLAKCCLNHRKKIRPTMEQVLATLQHIQQLQ